jgi:hypothetical protein
MTKRQDDESFRQDREWHTMDIEDVRTDADKIRYQRELRKRWESTEKPSDLPFAPMDATEWWLIAQQQLRRLKRSE